MKLKIVILSVSIITSLSAQNPSFKELTDKMVLPEYYTRLEKLLEGKVIHQTIHYSDCAIENSPSTVAYVKEKMQKSQVLESDAQNMEIAIAAALEKDKQINDNGIFAEFGVGAGKSANFIAQRIGNKILYGFDWYKGLPEDWRAPNFVKGTFAIKQDVSIPPFPLEKNIELVIGRFKETLPIFATSKNAPFLFIHIDCDLYSSTKEIFDNIKNHVIPGTIIVFDEYFNYDGWQEHEFKAFQEFIKENGFTYEYLCYNKLHQQVTVKITSIK
ncbi:TPA: hypothetical protein DEO28_01205 [Candidatus Dependentiae bacterium]|nr:MAG: hypothetical protein UR14_C0003G0091 [candidate division TM6 bacterium GW2011_GWE2_31_21]KKP53745.1 MAG: hypothetical protein UR43_C0003G0066 [candidate division TM6 bacterium GW2011_GWF2_33_332]HBS48501.1 hypothetical protein [Candidatus Dependentiae bacterium]HBZ73116.1 hypothetical protein [Candidatus Dependentiae bacterium]